MAVVPKQNGLEILRRLVPLNTLSDEVLSELMDAAAFEKIDKGRYLFREGDTDPQRVYLLSGSLSLVEDGKEVDRVVANSNMARYPVAQHVPRRYSAKARSKVEVVRIDGGLLGDLLSRGGGGIYQVQELSPDGDNDWMGQLLQSPIFQRIPAANIQNIMMRMEEIQASSGEMVIRQGDEGDYFYLLNQGQCAVTRETESGELQEIARLRAGECFGEESLLSGRPRSSTVCMLTDGVLFRLPKSDFVEYIKLPLANAISYQDARRRIEKGAVWLDVRSPLEHARVNIPDSRNIPFNELRQEGPGLETDDAYVVYCQDGLVSSTAVYLLMELGLDACVLERGLESVPDEDLEREEPEPDGAQVISLRPEHEAASTATPDRGSVPDDEAGLLRERLQKTEAQAQEQMQRARKMKLMLEKLKGRLAETEQASQLELEEKQQREKELERLRGQLKEQATNAGLYEAQQAQLEEVTGERDRLQSELDDLCRQVGQLEKRLEGREQDDSRKIKSLDSERAQLQEALDQAETELRESRSELSALKEEEQRLQASLQQASEEGEALKAEQAAREKAADEALRSAQQQVQEQEEALSTSLEQVASLETALAERGSNEQQQSERLAAAQQEAREREASLNASLDEARQQVASLEAALAERESGQRQQSEQLAAAEKQRQLLNGERDQLQAELEHASGQIARLESERREAEQSGKRQRLELEGALKEAQAAQQTTEAERLTAANERDRISAELAVLQGRYSQLQQTLQERDNSLAELRQGSGEKAQEEVSRLEQALEQVRAELREARDGTEADRQELETLREQLQSATAEAAGQQALEQELASLQAEREQLAEARTSLEEALREAQEKLAGLEAEQLGEREARERLEQALEQQRAETEQLKQATVSAPAGGDLKVLQAELATLNEALDEADHSYEELSRERDELKSTLEKLRLESGASGADQESEAQRLAAELDALGRELAQVREQAEADVGRLQEQLEAQQAEADESLPPVADGELEALQQALQEARGQLKELELSSSADAAEGEVLRQEIDKLRRSLEERTTELERTRKESLLLEEKTEERNSEIDRLKLALEAAQVDADEAQFKKQEALDARKQVEEALYQLQKQVESERPRDDLMQQSLTASDETPLLPGRNGGRRPLGALLVGAVLAFGLAEGIAIMGGKGELLSGLWTDNSESVVVDSASIPGSADPAPGERIPHTPAQAVAPETGSSSVEGPVGAETKPEAGITQEPVPPGKPEAQLPARPEPEPTRITEPEPVVAARPEPAAPPPREAAPGPARPTEPATGSPMRDRLASGGRGPEMVYIRGGEFEMGSSVHFLSREEQPVHRVEVPSFSIGRYEVTFRDYELFAAATGRRLPDDLGWGQGNRPVINVSWEDASAYAEWLSAETGRRYRLPSEAEWEYAAAAGTDTPYWWGFDLGSDRANCFNCGSQWDGVSTAPVGRFEANPFGLHNTAGNVMEWVSDCYHNTYTGAPSDGSSWQEAECSERVVRGGAFNKPGESLRVTRRNRHGPDARLFVLGFRVVREVN
ncbi:MAG: SUMF1/EgtB/PvdO family nonheme iron enzyme [Sedimenticola sp.]|nr:SUMF1/EgtB/PvdO family nonheme iron enzyme [Sedimenticola sp.]